MNQPKALKNIRSKVARHKSARQASILLLSTLTGVFLGMIVSVINTRALPPTEYGDVRYVNNYVSFFSGILLLGYFVSGSRLLAVARSPRQSSEIKGATLVILGITALGVILLTFFCGLVHQFILHKSFAYLFYVVLPVSLNSILLNYINTTSQGDNSIGMISGARLFPAFFYICISWPIYSFYGASPAKMLWLHNGISIIVLSILLILNRPSFHNLQHSLRLLNEENRQYGIHVYLGSLANLSIPYIAGVTLGLFAPNNSNVAFYTLALTISMPLSFVPSVIGTTYFKKFASQNTISPSVIKTTVLVTLISLCGYCIVIFPLVRFLYDSSYQTVAIFGCWLAIASSAQGLGDVFNRFLGAHAQGKSLRNGAWVSGAISLIGYIAGVYYWEINGAIATRICASVAYMLCMIYYYRKFIHNPIFYDNSNA